MNDSKTQISLSVWFLEADCR